MHDNPVPKGFGLIFNIFLFLIFYIYKVEITLNNDVLIPRFWFLFSGFIILTIVSFVDDFNEINPKIKLYFQIIIIYLSTSTLPINSHIIINENFFSFYIPFKIVDIFLIFIWIFIINISNFYDGLDRNLFINLLGISSGFLMLSYLNNENDSFYFISLTLVIFSIFGLLNYFKFNRFFLGDSGSIPIGYLLGWLFIIALYKNYFFELCFLFSVMIIDVTSVLLTKIIKKQNIFVRHNDFLFHQLYIYLKKRILIHNLIYLLIYILINISLYLYIIKSNLMFLPLALFALYIVPVFLNIRRIFNS